MITQNQVTMKCQKCKTIDNALNQAFRISLKRIFKIFNMIKTLYLKERGQFNFKKLKLHIVVKYPLLILLTRGNMLNNNLYKMKRNKFHNI